MSTARVVLLSGPSGAGKSRLARRLREAHGWPVVRLDDFYKDGDDPTLPMSTLGIPDWDDVRSFRLEAAVEALDTLCRTGTVAVPTYDIATSRATGTTEVRTDGAPCVVAEGIFAADVIAPLRERGLLHAAYCVRQGAWVTFARPRPVRAPQAAVGAAAPRAAAAGRRARHRRRAGATRRPTGFTPRGRTSARHR